MTVPSYFGENIFYPDKKFNPVKHELKNKKSICDYNQLYKKNKIQLKQ